MCTDGRRSYRRSTSVPLVNALTEAVSEGVRGTIYEGIPKNPDSFGNFHCTLGSIDHTPPSHFEVSCSKMVVQLFLENRYLLMSFGIFYPYNLPLPNFRRLSHTRRVSSLLS